MLSVFAGENSFEVARALGVAKARFSGEVETVDGAELAPEQLPSLLAGQTLFTNSRLVIIRNLSENKIIWPELERWFKNVPDDASIVLVEGKLDKRTAGYKWLKKHAELQEFLLWTPRDRQAAEEWLRAEAKRQNIALTHQQARQLLNRTGLDQWRLYRSLEKLALLDELNEASIEKVVEPHPEENVFTLLETALKNQTVAVQSRLSSLKQTEDAYRVFSLLASQVLQLSALTLSDKPSAQVAADIKAHPFVLSKLASYAKKEDARSVRQLLSWAADTDSKMKSTSTDPWVLVETLLLRIASR